MASSGGSSRRPFSGTRSFDFGSDEFMFPYEDYAPPKDQTANAKRSDSSVKLTTDLLENRVGRQMTNAYGQQEEFPREDVISSVELCMKKYADNLMRNLEEICGRLTKLELFCYKLERSVSEFRTDVIHGQSESNMKLKSLEKQVQEVQRSLQIIRDKQELVETQKELTKLHLPQTETALSSLSQKHNNEDAASNQQLALALPNQVSPAAPSRAPDLNLSSHHSPLASLNPPPHGQYILNQPDAPHPLQMSRMPILSAPTPPLPQPRLNQLTQQPQFTQYQQQWTPPVLRQHTPEAFQVSSMPPPTRYSSPLPNGYGASFVPQPHLKNGYMGASPYPPRSYAQGYNPAFSVDRSRAAPSQNYQLGKQSAHDHPNGEVIEKAVGMGYARDHAVSVVNQMVETGKPIDFNALLDGLNAHSKGAPPRAW
ncbi:hypothetical protein KSP39_PZI012376 [Platanthera zijinensis]|uniref:DUF1421 domain-containing protein n=1 Tax=Platanthera zijinensis TaxID=2320716 RepID=A0AAP0BHK8_9ASPA